MLSTAEINDIIKTIPSGYKTADDDFFKDADKCILQEYKKLGVINSTEEEDAATDGVHSNIKIHCNVPGCGLSFDGVAAYQTHFNSVHRYLCAECRRSLPTAHLLDLHISESHDSYFAARVARGHVMFACFLEECKEQSLTPKLRKEHCIKAHKFPANFRFDKLNGKLSFDVTKKTNRERHGLTMEVDEVKSTESNAKGKGFSFGHHKERSFLTKSGSRKAPGADMAVDMYDLKEALDDI